MLGAARERAICFHKNEAVPPEWRTSDSELTVRSSFTINLYPSQQGGVDVIVCSFVNERLAPRDSLVHLGVFRGVYEGRAPRDSLVQVALVWRIKISSNVCGQ